MPTPNIYIYNTFLLLLLYMIIINILCTFYFYIYFSVLKIIKYQYIYNNTPEMESNVLHLLALL